MSIIMCLAVAFGGLLALGLSFLLPNANGTRRRAIFAVGLFPPGVAAYLLACVIASSVLSSIFGTPDFAFGDINEPLPNGFHLTALGKMSQSGIIENPHNPRLQVAWVASLQTSGPLIFGQYDYTYFQRIEADANRNFFVLDTASQKIQNFSSESDLAAAVKTSLRLTPTPYFHGSRSAAYRALILLLFCIALVPPAVVGLRLLWWVRHLPTHPT